MSKDVSLGCLCPHLIGEERVALGPDRRTLYTSKPISGSTLLRVVANDNIPISPFTGTVSAAILKSSRREPYRTTLVSRVLRVVTRKGSATITFPVGYLSADRVIATVSAAAGSLVTVTAPNGYLVFTDTDDPGPSSKLQLSGTALEALGFDLQSGSRGRTVFPPWKLYSRQVVNPTDAVDSLGYYIGFDQPVSQGTYFTVTYPVAPYHCLRCLTSEVENDYRFDPQGAALTITDENLLYQSCLKVILTDLKSNIYYPWYGSTLKSLIGSKVLGGTASGRGQRPCGTNTHQLG